jgi:hypothetical protein
VRGCAHWRTPVEVAGCTVLCSRLLARPEDGGGFEPDCGVFLDVGWRWIAPASADSRIRIVKWPDFGVIAPDELSGLTDSVIHALQSGPVDIGCLGGHGRTGTLLATIIGRTESLDADDSIAAARARYCAHAVETPAQAALVAEALAHAPGT